MAVLLDNGFHTMQLQFMQDIALDLKKQKCEEEAKRAEAQTKMLVHLTLPTPSSLTDGPSSRGCTGSPTAKTDKTEGGRDYLFRMSRNGTCRLYVL